MKKKVVRVQDTGHKNQMDAVVSRKSVADGRKKIKQVIRKEHEIIISSQKIRMMNGKRNVKVKIHRTSDYDDKYTGIRDFPDEKAMLHYGLSKVQKVIITKYASNDELSPKAQKTRGMKFDYDMELCD